MTRQALPSKYTELNCAVTLWRSLKDREGQYLAVRCDGPLNWSIVNPRTQGAILFACETDEHAILERLADILGPYCNDDLERAFVLARDCLAALMPESSQ